jgi:hypothetical protein
MNATATQREIAIRLLSEFGHQPERFATEWENANLPSEGTKPGKLLRHQVYVAWLRNDTDRLAALLERLA